MAQVNQLGPQPVSQSTPNTSSASVPCKLSAQIDLLVAIQLWSWPALTLAIQNNWGGSAQVSNDKREWLGGQISELLTSKPPQLADVGDLEEVLLQVMIDEFEIVVDDDSAEETARKIWNGCAKVVAGDTSELEEVYAKWQEKQKKGGDNVVAIVRGEDKEADDTDWDDEDNEEEEFNGFPDRPDVAMDEAPPLIDIDWMQKKKTQPEVDEEGFTKVVNKKKK